MPIIAAAHLAATSVMPRTGPSATVRGLGYAYMHNSAIGGSLSAEVDSEGKSIT
jgi:hypothetical protein